jgi:hypothetical protein
MEIYLHKDHLFAHRYCLINHTIIHLLYLLCVLSSLVSHPPASPISQDHRSPDRIHVQPYPTQVIIFKWQLAHRTRVECDLSTDESNGSMAELQQVVREFTCGGWAVSFEGQVECAWSDWEYF